MQKYCPVCDTQMDVDVCDTHGVPTVDEACFNRPHVPIIPGDMVDGVFHVIRVLGEGSMGTVYEVSTENEPRLALKVIKVREDSSRQVTKRFYREALAGSKVSHPGVVQILQFGVDARTGQPYQAMEFIEGQTLFEYMGNAVKSVDTALSILTGVLDALDHLHQCGIVHRDLKPENVMIVDSNETIQIKLLDFGIAKILEHDGDAPTLTATGVAVGTPHYMSPEQAKGSKISVSADLYSVGCMVFELLTGHPPFDGADFMSVLISHVRDPVPHLPPMTPWGEAIPDELREAVYLSLSKDPSNRASSARAMKDSLTATPDTQTNEPALEDPQSKGSMTSVESNPINRAVLGIVILGLLSAIGWFLLQF